MKTYIFAHKNSSDGFTTTADSEQEAWDRIKEIMKSEWGWRLQEVEEQE